VVFYYNNKKYYLHVFLIKLQAVKFEYGKFYHGEHKMKFINTSIKSCYFCMIVSYFFYYIYFLSIIFADFSTNVFCLCGRCIGSGFV